MLNYLLHIAPWVGLFWLLLGAIFLAVGASLGAAAKRGDRAHGWDDETQQLIQDIRSL